MEAHEGASLDTTVDFPGGRKTIPSLLSDRPARHLLCCALQVGMGVSCASVVKPVDTGAARAVATIKAAVVAVVSQRKAGMFRSSVGFVFAVSVGKGGGGR